MKPLVSIIVPCFNQGVFLRTAVDSCLAQTYGRVEVVVVNDGSTDDTSMVISEYGRSVSGIVQANLGLSAARNAGILAARGEYVLFLDADDYIGEDAIGTLMNAEGGSGAGSVAYGGWISVDQDGRQQSRHPASAMDSDPFHQLLEGTGIVTHCFLIPRQVFARVGLFDCALRSCEDWDMWLKVAATGIAFRHVAGEHAFYRRYSGTMSRNYSMMWESGQTVLRRYSGLHGACSRCRAASARGRAAFRGYLFDTAFWNHIRALRSQGRNAACLALVSRRVWADPALLRLLRGWASGYVVAKLGLVAPRSAPTS